MDPISSLLKLLEYQRQQSTSKVNTDLTRGKAKNVDGGGQLAGHGAATLEEVRQSVKEQLKKMNQKDPDFGGKAFHVFVHNILTWKLGAEVVNDTAFNEVVYEVEHLMLKDPNLKRQFEDMLKELM